MFYIVWISTKKYHCQKEKFSSLRQAWEYLKDNLPWSFGAVIRDGNTGKRYSLYEAERTVINA